MSAPGQGGQRDGIRWVYAIGVALIAVFVAGFVAKNVRLQWDFRTYLAAAECAWRGLDPYVIENLRAVSGRPIELPFVYPPAALVAFLPFVALPGAVALWAWIALKAAAMIALVLLWRIRFLPAIEWLPLAMAAVFGFNAALLWDLRSGNVAMFEIALLWLAFACYVRHQRARFGVLVAVAAIFKIAPLAFLALLLVPANGVRPRPRSLVALVLAFTLTVVGPTLVPPAAGWSGFATHAARAFPAGDANPGALALAWALWSATGAGEAWPRALTTWSVYVVALIALSIPWCLSTWRRRDPVDWVMGASLLFVLLWPRPMAYGYLLAIPAVLHFAQSIPGGRTASLLVAMLLSMQGLARVASYPLQGLLSHHLPFLMTLGLWLAVAAGALRGPAPAAAAGDPPQTGLAA